MSDGNSAWRDNTIDNSSVRGVKRIESANNAGRGGYVAIGPNNDESSVHDSGIRYYNANDFNDTSSIADVHRKQKRCGIDMEEAPASRLIVSANSPDTRKSILISTNEFNTNYSKKDEHMVKRDYNANDVMEMYPILGVHREHEHSSNKGHTSLGGSRLNVSGNSPDFRGVVSTSSDDRLSLPKEGRDNSNPAFNSFQYAGSQFKVYSGEFKSFASRSEILTVVNDGQAGLFISNKDDVGGSRSDRSLGPTLVARIPADKYTNDSMGVLPHRSVARSPVTKLAGGIINDSDEVVRNADIIYDQECVISKSVSDSIFQWIMFNDFAADIHSMGEILSNLSDLAIVISADEVEAWTQEAGEILKEKIPRVANVSELMLIDYNEVVTGFKANKKLSIDASSRRPNLVASKGCIQRLCVNI